MPIKAVFFDFMGTCLNWHDSIVASFPQPQSQFQARTGPLVSTTNSEVYLEPSEGRREEEVREGKVREGKVREGKVREGKVREGKGKGKDVCSQLALRWRQAFFDEIASRYSRGLPVEDIDETHRRTLISLLRKDDSVDDPTEVYYYVHPGGSEAAGEGEGDRMATRMVFDKPAIERAVRAWHDMKAWPEVRHNLTRLRRPSSSTSTSFISPEHDLSTRSSLESDFDADKNTNAALGSGWGFEVQQEDPEQEKKAEESANVNTGTRCQLFVLANGTTKLQLDLVRSSGLHACFDMLFSSQLLGLTKPAPQIYLKAIELVGGCSPSLSPDDCLMVAAHAYDLRAAKAVGMKTVYVRRWTEDRTEDMSRVRWENDAFLENGMEGLRAVVERL